MTERNIGRPWTEHEDQLLKDAVANHGEHDNWKNIALCIPGRTNKACRKRWLHSLSPDLKKTAWTLEEDKLLMDLHDQHGAKWSTIARSIPGRTDDACSKRYREALDPSLKKDEWTPEEDAKLLQVFNRIGGKWGQIGQEMQRSGLGCRNRWRLLERKKAAAKRAGAQVVASSSASVTSTKDSSSSSSVVSPNDRTPTPPEQNRTPPSSSRSSPAPSSTRVALPVEEGPAAETQTSNLSRSQSGSVVDMWPPYFPPESYLIHGSSLSPSHSFRIPSPQLVPLSPNIAPFQFSSSSLSTALSAPPQLPRPLPPVSNEPPLMALELDSDLFSSADHTQGTEQLLENDDSLMSLDDPLLSVTTETIPSSMEQFTTALLPPVFTPPLLQHSISLHPQHPSIPVSPTSHSNDIPIHIDRFQVSDIWKSPGPLVDFLAPLLEQSPQSSRDNNLQMDANFDDFSSASSTPYLFSSSLSATSSPNVSSPIDLPYSEQSGNSTGSLLFSTSREPMRSFQPSRNRRPIPNKKLLKTGTPMRLSSSLPLTADPSIKPYACGTDTCWPPGATTSRSCFMTSKELFDHNKAEHADEPYTEKPYRCALAGCGKSWKSINGLQYHLQISTAHFRTALSSRFSTQSLNEEAGSGTEPEVDENEREFVCPIANCFKAYKHSSGLRYHMKHGHPQNLPAQLLEVPPTLARQIPLKARRMRRKARSEEL